jgi:hypothetical protein
MRRTKSIFRALAPLPIVLAVLAGCSHDSSSVATGAQATTTAPQTTATPARATATSTTPATGAPTTASPTTSAAPLSGDSRLRVDGIGPVSVGMTLAEASKAAGVPLERTDGPYCTALRTPGVAGLTLISTNSSGGRIDLITVGPGPVTTVSGIRIGSSLEDLRRAYPESQLHARLSSVNGVPQPGRAVFQPNDPALADFSMTFSLSERQVVEHIDAGRRAQAESDEPCA